MEITNKYQNGKIYQIVDIGYNKCYIGSTTEGLSLRMARHRAAFKRFLSSGKGSHIRSYDLFNEYGIENCKIELIEYYSCNSKDELRAREGQHQRELECVNKRVEKRTRKEYREINKENRKTYLAENRDRIRECETLWRQNNKDKKSEINKRYYEKQKALKQQSVVN